MGADRDGMQHSLPSPQTPRLGGLGRKTESKCLSSPALTDSGRKDMSRQTPAMTAKRKRHLEYLRTHPDANLAAVGRMWHCSRQYVWKLREKVSEFPTILRKAGAA